MVRITDSEPRAARASEQAKQVGPIAFVGAGQMGAPMVRRLLAAQAEVVLYARRPDVRETFAALGARTTSSLEEVATGAHIVISCLFNESQVADVLLGPHGLIARAEPGTVLVSHTTIGLDLLTRVDQAATVREVSLLDAPVSGAPDDIEAGQLTILVGGEAGAIDRTLPVLHAYGNAVRTGGVGTASRVKLINNLLYAVNVQTAAAAAILGRELGIETGALFASVLRCSAASRAMQSMHDVGSLEEFTQLGAKYLQKDVSAAIQAAVESGADAGLLASIATHGPLPLAVNTTAD